ncbi:hypothetical protein D3C71_2021570 [compost metagenome]
MTDVLKRQFARFGKIAPGTDDHEKRRAAIGSSAAMIGALILARMTDDPDLSTEILDETRVWLSDRDHGKLRSQGPSDGKSDAGS